MADIFGMKISELPETTDLDGLYTVGSDRNTNSRKVSLGFLKEAANYANAQGDYAKGVGDTVAGNVGATDYPVFSASGIYKIGDVVRFGDRLYRFTAPHQSGSWNGADVELTSVNEEAQRKVSELKEETDQKLTELSGEINGKTKQEFLTQAGAGLAPWNVSYPFTIKAGTFKVRLIDPSGVLSVNAVALYAYDADGNTILDGENVPKTFASKTAKADIAKIGLYVSGGNVKGTGSIFLEFEGDTIKKGLITNLNNLQTVVNAHESKISILDKNAKSLYYEDGGINGDEEIDNALASRSYFIPVVKGDTISSWIYRVKLYNDKRVYIGEDLTSSNGGGLKTYTITNEACKYVRLMCLRGEEYPIYLNGKDVIPFLLGESRSNGQGGSQSIKIVSSGKQFESNEGVIEIPIATDNSLGFMSAADKQKLNNLQAGNITIEGSGIYKNAAAYGFLPTNDGDTNAINLQNCVKGGGTIVIDITGTYQLSQSILLDNNTTLYFGNGTSVSLTKSSSGKIVTYPFINRGAFVNEINENISIIGLRLKTNSLQNGNDVTRISGQRGYIAMKGIKNLQLKDIEILDVPDGWYSIHIQQFENINLEHIHVEGMKDGIHLGVGKKYRIAHCLFKTNDDSIALNAHDYPSGTSEFGWIEDGIIEDVQILPTPTGNTSRGVYLLGGAWADWKSGNSYQPLGDTCVSNNGVYVTNGTRSTTKVSSTQQPNHASGSVTYSDGLTWHRLDNLSATYNAGVRDLIVRDLRISSNGRAMTFNLDNDSFSRSLYDNCAAPSFDNITLQGLRQDQYASEYVIYTLVPFSNFKMIDCDFKNGFRGITLDKLTQDKSTSTCSLLTMGLSMYMNYNMFIKNDTGQRVLNAKMIGTMEYNKSIVPMVYAANSIDIESDITLNKVNL